MQSVGTLAELLDHLSQETAEIELAEGLYGLDGTELAISHDVIIRAAHGATVVLDGEDKSSVLSIAGGVVTLSGLSITGGRHVSACFWNSLEPSPYMYDPPGQSFQRVTM